VKTGHLLKTILNQQLYDNDRFVNVLFVLFRIFSK